MSHYPKTKQQTQNNYTADITCLFPPFLTHQSRNIKKQREQEQIYPPKLSFIAISSLCDMRTQRMHLVFSCEEMARSNPSYISTGIIKIFIRLSGLGTYDPWYEKKSFR